MDTSVMISLFLSLWGACVMALPQIEGNEVGIWSQMSVVYGRVRSVEVEGGGKAAVEIEVHATLTGPFDAAAHHRVKAEMYYGLNRANDRAPKPGSPVVALLRYTTERLVIPSVRPMFMPTQSPIMEVESFGDPKVHETIRALRKVRKVER